MRLNKLRIIEVKKIYVDGLEDWIEVPVWEQDELLKFVNEIDWDGLDMRQYKKMLVEHWPGLSASVKSKVKAPAARDELYDVLIHENWALKPSEAMSPRSYYSEAEKNNVMAWFASAKVQGRPPEVLSNG